MSPLLRAALLLLVVLATAVPALADVLPTNLLEQRDADAAAGRTYIAPTAVVGEAGKVTATARAAILPVALGGTLGATLAISDRLELGVGGAAWVVIEDEGSSPDRIGFAHAKLQILRSDRAAVALMASVYRRAGYLERDDFSPSYGTRHPVLVSGTAGVVATTCADPACGTIISGHLALGADVAGGERRTALGGVGLSAGRGGLRFIAEASATYLDEHVALFAYGGARWSRRHVSFDAGLAVLAADGGGIPLPTLALSFRN